MSACRAGEEYAACGDGLLELSPERLRSLLRSEPITNIYHVEQTPFARGKFASVRKIRHLETGVEYAAKFIRKRRRAADSTREIHHEVAVLALCAGSSRIVRLHEVFDMRSEVAIVLELASGGELQRVLDEEERLSEAAARRAMRHVLEGLRHLHARRVAHLDLKPQNLLLDEATRDVCICDFGISRAIRPGAVVREILGTTDYVAPEILSYEPISLAADVWSAGVLAYVLLSGYSPFAGATKQETYLNIARCSLTFPEELFDDVSALARDFITATLVLDPECRLTVEQCLEHPWLQDDEGLLPRDIGLAADSTELSSDSDTDGADSVDERGGVTGVTGVNGSCASENGVNGVNGDAEEERDKPLKHPHGRETSPPFPDAPSTPKVSRKSHPASPTSVRQLCKKFQPDYPEKVLAANTRDKQHEAAARKGAAHAHPAHAAAAKENSKPCGCGYECAECRPLARGLRPSLPPLPPDRAITC